MSTASFACPFEVVWPRPLTLKARERKPPDLGPKIRVEGVHLSPGADDASLAALINGAGLRDTDKDGLREHDNALKNMWRGSPAPDTKLEFDLPEAVPVGAIEVWNFNGEWQTTNGTRKLEVAVSPDGTTWQTVLRDVELAEADGRADYDEPVVLKFPAVKARKVRFENLRPWGAGGPVGLSEVVFHQAPGTMAGPLEPEDGAKGLNAGKLTLKWVVGDGAKEHRVLLGTAPDKLEPLGNTPEPQYAAPALKPDAAYFWRVDEVGADGKVATGRVARFDTSGLVAWWRLDESKGNKAEDATGHQFTGNVVSKPNWAPGQGRIGGAMEFDGKATFINCGRAPEFDFRDAMTVAAWVKVREFNKTWQAIVTKGDTSWRLQREGDTGNVTFSFNTGAEVELGDQNLVSLISRQRVDDGQWHHLVGVVEGNRAALYVDGELSASAAAKPIAPNSAPVMIGCNSTAYERRFNGWIDEVRLYGYGLSAAEVKALYQAGGSSVPEAK